MAESVQHSRTLLSLAGTSSLAPQGYGNAGGGAISVHANTSGDTALSHAAAGATSSGDSRARPVTGGHAPAPAAAPAGKKAAKAGKGAKWQHLCRTSSRACTSSRKGSEQCTHAAHRGKQRQQRARGRFRLRVVLTGALLVQATSKASGACPSRRSCARCDAAAHAPRLRGRTAAARAPMVSDVHRCTCAHGGLLLPPHAPGGQLPRVAVVCQGLLPTPPRVRGTPGSHVRSGGRRGEPLLPTVRQVPAPGGV